MDNPYCDECGACGEEGCCDALKCEHTKNGEYCEGYLLDLKFGYMMYKDLQDLVSDEDFSRIFDKNYEIIYK